VETVEPAQVSNAKTADTAEVRLSVPAHGAFLSLIRTTTAAVAARIDLTIDEIEDLRIAVDEAAAMLLPELSDDARVDVRYHYDTTTFTIVLASATGAGTGPDQSGFGWTVLQALAGSVTATVADGTTTITLVHHRSPVAQG
jgi:serine/threonine-protein kinase RsbW